MILVSIYPTFIPSTFFFFSHLFFSYSFSFSFGFHLQKYSTTEKKSSHRHQQKKGPRVATSWHQTSLSFSQSVDIQSNALSPYLYPSPLLYSYYLNKHLPCEHF